MENEIIYVCHSTNNKNVRLGELNILEKHEDQLYFEFGSDEMNVKKRFYNDLETLNKDFNALLKLKDKEKIIKDENLSEETEEVQENVLEDLVQDEEEPKKFEKKSKRKNSLF